MFSTVFIKKIFLFAGLFYSASLFAQDWFQPDFKQNPIFFSQGQILIPLCADPLDPICIDQWSQQGLPMALQVEGGTSHVFKYQYFMPALIFDEEIPEGLRAKDIKESKNWKPLKLPSFSVFENQIKEDRRFLFYVKKTSEEGGVQKVAAVFEDDSEHLLTGSVFMISEMALNLNPSHSFTTSKDTIGLPAKLQSDSPEVCFKILNKEVDFCSDCDETSKEESTDFFSFFPLFERLKGSESEQTFSISQICAPRVSLDFIIDNFNKTCNYSFKEFFKKALCKSQDRSWPLEILLAQMSVQSNGICHQEGEKREVCLESEEGSASLQCLRNPDEELEIFFEDYINASVENKNMWTEVFLSDQGYDLSSIYYPPQDIKLILNGSYYPVKESEGDLKNDKDLWKKIKFYYFIKKLYDKGVSQDSPDDIHLAHTELILGSRENSDFLMRDIWMEHIRDFVKASDSSLCFE